MKLIFRLLALFLIVGVSVLFTNISVYAREVITFTKANGGEYFIVAYNSSNRSYYSINGKFSSDSQKVNVPRGYASTVTVLLGRAAGSRNLYEKRDPMNPIFEVRKKSTFVLELLYKGKGASSAPQTQGALPQGILPKVQGGGPGVGRAPPP